jgi:methionyl-tRNA formyltransferase
VVSRIIFLGTPGFAVPSLRALIQSPLHEVVAVITQPDRKAGRGQKLSSPPVKLLAAQHDIPVCQVQSLRKDPEALALLKRMHPDLCIVVAFGQILKAEFFDYPPFGTLNVHASLLPAYRGAAPVAHTILNGETESGATIMKIDEGMDTGDVLKQRSVAITPEMTSGDLESLLAQVGADLLLETIPGFIEGDIKPVPQDHELATYAPKIDREKGCLDWSLGAPQLHNMVRAFNPWPGAFFHYGQQVVKVWRTSVAHAAPTAENVKPGTVLELTDNKLLVQCGNKTVLALNELQMPNRKRIGGRDFMNGCQLKHGDRLSPEF